LHPPQLEPPLASPAHKPLPSSPSFPLGNIKPPPLRRFFLRILSRWGAPSGWYENEPFFPSLGRSPHPFPLSKDRFWGQFPLARGGNIFWPGSQKGLSLFFGLSPFHFGRGQPAQEAKEFFQREAILPLRPPPFFLTTRHLLLAVWRLCGAD